MPFLLFDYHWDENEPPPSAQLCFEGSEEEDEPLAPSTRRNTPQRQDASNNDEGDAEMRSIDDITKQPETEIEPDLRIEDVLSADRDHHYNNDEFDPSIDARNPPFANPSVKPPSTRLEETKQAPLPPQSHFATFANFTPNNNAGFDDEFSRLASSQHSVPGSQEYTR